MRTLPCLVAGVADGAAVATGDVAGTSAIVARVTDMTASVAMIVNGVAVGVA